MRQIMPSGNRLANRRHLEHELDSIESELLSLSASRESLRKECRGLDENIGPTTHKSHVKRGGQPENKRCRSPLVPFSYPTGYRAQHGANKDVLTRDRFLKLQQKAGSPPVTSRGGLTSATPSPFHHNADSTKPGEFLLDLIKGIPTPPDCRPYAASKTSTGIFETYPRRRTDTSSSSCSSRAGSVVIPKAQVRYGKPPVAAGAAQPSWRSRLAKPAGRYSSSSSDSFDDSRKPLSSPVKLGHDDGSPVASHRRNRREGAKWGEVYSDEDLTNMNWPDERRRLEQRRKMDLDLEDRLEQQRQQLDTEHHRIVSAIQTELEEVRAKRSAEKDSFHNKERRLLDESRQLQSELERMSRELSEAKTTVETTKIQMQHREHEVRRLESETERVQAENLRIVNENKDLKHELNEFRGQLGTIKADLNETMNEKTRLELRLADMRRNLELQQKELTSKTDELTTAKASIKALNHDVETQRDELKQLKICNSQYLTSIGETNNEIQKNLLIIRDWERKYNKCSTDLIESEAKLERTLQELSRVEDSAHHLKGSYDELQTIKPQLQHVAQQRDKALEDLSSAQAELRKVVKQAHGTKLELEETKNKLLHAEQETHKARKCLQELQSQLPPLLHHKIDGRQSHVGNVPKIFQQTTAIIGSQAIAEGDIAVQSQPAELKSPAPPIPAGISHPMPLVDEYIGTGRQAGACRNSMRGHFSLERPPWAQDWVDDTCAASRSVPVRGSRDGLAQQLTTLLLEKCDIQAELSSMDGTHSSGAPLLTTTECRRKKSILESRLRELETSVMTLRNKLYPK